MQKREDYLKKKRQKKRKAFHIITYISLIFSSAFLFLAFHYFFDEKPKEEASLFRKNLKFQTNNSSARPLTMKEGKHTIDKYLKKIGFNGTAVVVKDGTILLNKGYGFSNLTKNSYNHSSTVFYIGSITKSFVSTAIMQLQEQGRLNVNNPLSMYIPFFPHAEEITLNELLTHTSGIPRREETSEKLTKQQLINKIASSAKYLTSTPGTKWGYSDSNYSILGYIVEKVSGMPLHEYIKKNIFQVAGMKHSGFGNALLRDKNTSSGYKKVWGVYYSPGMPDFSQVFGCGDIYTTAYDLYKFDHALATGKLVTKESYKQIFTPHQSNYGYGWYINRKGWSVKPGIYSNHGVLPGWNSVNSFSPEGKTYVILLSNIQNKIKNIGKVNKKIYMKLAYIHH
ncbi:penicillin-binding protein [Heyndrickxia sporothermodurans]|nr:penicillin-binding protein [Heyndrickxia sporothermodurans]